MESKIGIGYRPELKKALVDNINLIDFVEVITDQFLDTPLDKELLIIADSLPVYCHCLNMSLGSAEPLNESYLNQLKFVFDRLRPTVISDHLAFTNIDGLELGHLTPVAFTQETISIISNKINYIQERYQIPFLIENITYDFLFPGSYLRETDMLNEIVRLSNCGILLDLTNVVVNSFNNNYDPEEFLKSLPLEKVIQVHLGGAIAIEGVWHDTHSHPVPAEAFELLKIVGNYNPSLSILIERDRNIQDVEEIFNEAKKARELRNQFTNQTDLN